jgi:transcriptional accessory protein Tex/SPT6
LQAADYTNEEFGLPTVTDILQELEKPGRDPRPEFKSVTFKAGIETDEASKGLSPFIIRKKPAACS